MVETGLILGIESSCDETAAAVVRSGSEALSNVVASQMDLHANYGGVVPELASREHLRNIVPIVRAAIAKAGITFADLDAIAVTEGPGLAGALLVGITYAKALAYGLNKPLIGVNHLEGHIHAVVMEASQRNEAPIPLPLLALVVSGGHTHLYLARQASKEQGRDSSWQYQNVGRTVDDAAGEAYDKVAKLLGLGYPGGPWIDALAPHGNPRAVPFTFAQIKPRAQKLELASSHSLKSSGAPSFAASSQRVGSQKPDLAQTPGLRFDFSFSGIKTAVLRYTQTHNMRSTIEHRRAALADNPSLKPNAAGITEALTHLDHQALDLIASFQHAVVGNLLRQTFAAAEAYGARGILVSGGVAANSELRRRFQSEATRRGLPVAFPSFALSTDNAAMIAAAAWPKFLTQNFAPEDLTATPQLRLG